MEPVPPRPANWSGDFGLWLERAILDRMRAFVMGAFALSAVFMHVVSSFGQGTGPGPVTFFVASDSHFGARGMSDLNRSVVQQMNELPGRAYPAEIGGQVAAPRGVVFTET